MTEITSWTLIRSAACGAAGAREEFGRRYLPVVRAYLQARWSRGRLANDVDDAVQEVFLRCYREGGPLERADHDRAGGFQPYLHGICRHVAHEFETARARSALRSPTDPPGLDELPGREERFSQVFDRAFARQIMREARALLTARAPGGGNEASRRLELLRLRFEEGLTIREVAERWKADPARLHHDYARARQEFRRALLDVGAGHLPGRTAAEVEAWTARLLEALA